MPWQSKVFTTEVPICKLMCCSWSSQPDVWEEARLVIFNSEQFKENFSSDGELKLPTYVVLYFSALWKGSTTTDIHSMQHVFVSHGHFLFCSWCRPVIQRDLEDLTIGCCQMIPTVSASVARY